MPHRVARAIGDQGEQLAAEHLQSHGVRIVERNWRCRLGEIDIIGLDGQTVVFYEVKTRRSTRYGSPAQAVTAAKAARLRRLAGYWLAEQTRYAADVRIDVLAISLRTNGAEIEHLRGVS